MIEIENVDQLKTILNGHPIIENTAFQGINMLSFDDMILERNFHDCLFLGCILGEKLTAKLMESNFIFPSLNVPYPTHPTNLYSTKTLYQGFNPKDPNSYRQTLDAITYQHFIKTGKSDLTLRESLARRLHDHGITNAMQGFLENYDEQKIVAIMGGHALLRTDRMYKKVAIIASKLFEKGCLLVSGGGPGAMEATHLGVWLSGRPKEEWDEALLILSQAPSYKDQQWLSTAFKVMEAFPRKKNAISLGIPTWLYGHEPPTPFASHIAKYFANSVREDGLLAIAKGGVIFSPGSAGTIQEIFQDATQNHYLTEEIASPMIFLGKKYWKKVYPIFPLLNKLRKEKKYKNLNLSIENKAKKVVAKIC